MKITLGKKLKKKENKTPKPKRKPSKKVKISLIILAVIIGAGAGFAIYHFMPHEEKIDLNSIVEEKSNAYYTDLKDSATTLTSNDKILDYLCNWAETKDITYKTDSAGNVIMSVKSSKEYKKAAPTVLVCTYDSTQIQSCLPPIAAALCVVKNNQNTGALTVIFTPSCGNDFVGIKALDDSYFKDNSNVFALNGGEKAMFSTKTGAMSTYTLNNSIETTKPTGTKALKIKIEGLPGGTPDGRISSYPNPVKLLSDLLASFKTNAYIYELGSFKGGTDAGVYPCSAEMTIVIGTDTMEKFTERLDSEIEDFVNDYSEDYPDATYSYEEVKIPDKVLTDDSNNKFVSLMYTMDNGVYYRDNDDELVSIMNIGAVKQSGSKFTIKVTANSLSDANLVEIDTSQHTICSLSDASFKKNDTIKVWSGDMKSEFAGQVAAAFNTYSGYTMEYVDQVQTTAANYIFQKNKQCNIMSVTLHNEKIERYAGTIITFLQNLLPEE